jgi:hypothetical protein
VVLLTAVLLSTVVDGVSVVVGVGVVVGTAVVVVGHSKHSVAFSSEYVPGPQAVHDELPVSA